MLIVIFASLAQIPAYTGLGGGANPVMALVLVWVGVLLVFSARGRRVRVLNVVMNALLFPLNSVSYGLK